MRFFQYSEFYAIEEIGAGGYGTVYKAEHNSINGIIALKCFKHFDQMPELLITEVRNYWTIIYNVSLI
jgi:hypothetical protein